MPQIEIRTHADGRVEIKGVGFEGSACEDPLDKALAAYGKTRADVIDLEQPELHLGANEQVEENQ